MRANSDGEAEDEFIMGMSDGTLGVVARGESVARFLPIQKGTGVLGSFVY